MKRRDFLGAAAASVFAPQFGRWFARSSGVLVGSTELVAAFPTWSVTIQDETNFGSFLNTIKVDDMLRITDRGEAREARVTKVNPVTGLLAFETLRPVTLPPRGMVSVGMHYTGPVA